LNIELDANKLHTYNYITLDSFSGFYQIPDTESNDDLLFRFWGIFHVLHYTMLLLVLM